MTLDQCLTELAEKQKRKLKESVNFICCKCGTEVKFLHDLKYSDVGHSAIVEMTNKKLCFSCYSKKVLEELK